MGELVDLTMNRLSGGLQDARPADCVKIHTGPGTAQTRSQIHHLACSAHGRA